MTEYRDDEQYLPDYAREEPRQGMSGGMKVLMVMLVLGGVMMLLCCGVFFWFGTRLSNAVTEDPDEIAEIRELIATVDIPEDFTPQVGMNINMFVFSMDLVAYGRDEEAFIMLMQMQAAGEGQEEIEQQFRQQAFEQSDAEEVDIESTTTHTFEINGRECDFVFAKGTMEEDGTEVRQVSGTFPGKNGVAFLLYQVMEEDWDEAAAAALILSLDENGAGRRVEKDEADDDIEPAGDGDTAAPNVEEPTDETGEEAAAPAEPTDDEAAAEGDPS
ncbi:hypothetical protein Mal4_48450 [Maioricimonas rarisocia]|uniref:Uncharacterized protein n=1 Tax=Maioricimonas rarisocia TaxID=2528026 RepID=A0A517ZDD8_9PLAN|nr:hypothetical protein [Maioricimonas rarisocia]QDU40487.1 hypothetical protein Mal4_48450 [Maioricimonas rarisocia]